METVRSFTLLLVGLCLGIASGEETPDQLHDLTVNAADESLGYALAKPILEAIHRSAMHSGDPVSVSFVRGDSSVVFQFHPYHSWTDPPGLKITPPHIFVRTDRVEIDGEERSVDGLKEFLTQYQDAADRTGASISLLVSSSPGAKVRNWMDCLEVFAAFDVRHLILSERL